MNFLLDFLPLLLFFLSFKWAEHHADAVAQTLTAAAAWLGLDWQVPVSQAPAMLGTLVVIVSTALQITFMRARRMPIPPMLLVSGGIGIRRTRMNVICNAVVRITTNVPSIAGACDTGTCQSSPNQAAAAVNACATASA